MKFWIKSGAWASKRARRIVAQLVPEKIARIGVIRHAALGDMVLTRPFLVELRRHFPNASITLSIVTNYTRGTPEDLVDRVHVAYGSDQKNVSLSRQIARARELGEQDILFDLAASVRSFWVCALNRARLKIGFPYHAIQRSLFYDAAVLRSDFRFEADTMLDMLNLLGMRTEFPLRYALPGTALSRARPYVLYFPGASTPDRCWPADRFSELVRRMAKDDPGVDHLVLAGRAPWESAEQLLAPLAGMANVERVVRDDLNETISLVKGARLLISNDTGIRHLGIAAEIPTVGIFYTSSPFLYWPRMPIHDNVFNADGSPPSVDAVYASARMIMGR